MVPGTTPPTLTDWVAVSDVIMAMKSSASRLAAVVISVALASTLFLSSLVIAADDGGFKNAHPVGGDTNPKNEQSLQTSSHGQHGIDWASYSDESGFVDVIMTVSDRSSYDMESFHSLGLGKMREFRLGLRGVAAHLKVDQLRSLLASTPSIQVYPDLTVKALVSSNNAQIGADQVWAYQDASGRSVKGTGVVVAIVDTGVDYSHPDLGGGYGPSFRVIGGYDFVNDDSDPMDDNGHGTHVAGIVAASGGMTGVAPDAKILAYKVLGSDGYGRMSDVILGIEAAMDPNGDSDTSDHADIVSMSLGAEGSVDDPVCMAVENAIEAGVVVVVAAGNDGPSLGTVSSPGLAPDAITVGAIDSAGALASFSSRGTLPELSVKPEVSAPGVSIVSTVPKSNAQRSSPSGYLSMSGTSMAAPHAAGAAALLLQLHPFWTPGEVKSALVTGAKSMIEPLWFAGAGSLWVPSAADTNLFVSEPIISYGLPNGVDYSFSIANSVSSLTLTASTSDWHALEANASIADKALMSLSHVTPSSVYLPSQGGASASLVVSVPAMNAPQGYFEGVMELKDATHDLRIPFAYAIVSRLNVHLFDMSGTEFFDPNGGIWAYTIPDAEVAAGITDGQAPSKPVAFLLPAGTYSVHAAGHHLFNSYTDPYFLSGIVSLDPLQTLDLNLMMSGARQMKLDLTTDDGNPIFVMDFLMYGRYTGAHNVSFQVSHCDGLIKGTSIFYLPKSKTIYVSDTAATIGVSLVGYSYSAGMWDFMKRNSDHWFEFLNSTSTEFRPEATADLQYMLSWEFQGVDASSNLNLDVIEGKASTYLTKYDIPGSIGNVWGYMGTHMGMGGDSGIYLRRTSYVSLNAFFSGMTRKTVVQGVYTGDYWPGSIFEEKFVRTFYSADYSHTIPVSDIAGAYLPDRNYLMPIEGVSKTNRIGAGPFYPSIRIENRNDTMILVQPVLRDQGGAAVFGASAPSMQLYRDGVLIDSRTLTEYRASPAIERIVNLPGSGTYLLKVDYSLALEICNHTSTTFSFKTPSVDVNPPQITGLVMPQRFASGQTVSLQLTAEDDNSISDVYISWRPKGTTGWIDVPVSDIGLGVYGSAIQTTASDEGIDLMLKVIDSSGNYVQYLAYNAALKQLPVLFDISVSPNVIDYNSSDASVLLSGSLTDLGGNPLSQIGGVPLELMINGRKVAMIVDDYVAPVIHRHDGTIRFEWHFNPVHIFEAPNRSVNIDVIFDLGIYEPVTRTISLKPTKLTNDPPVITLVSPLNNSLVSAGQMIDLSIEDDGFFTATSYLDGKQVGELTAPWNVATSSWSEGTHVLEIVAVDDEQATSRASFRFDVDAEAPIVTVLYPKDGERIPLGATLVAEILEARLLSVYYSADGGPAQTMISPYRIDMSRWTPGNHNVVITAIDRVGHLTSKSTSFEIVNSTVVVQLMSPANGGALRSGTPILFSTAGNGNITSRWSENGIWRELGALTAIQTSGWSEGDHYITINATNDLGGYNQISVVVAVDNTSPVISLTSPSNNSYVLPSDFISIHVSDMHLQSVSWGLWSENFSSKSSDIVIPLDACPSDGYFTLSISSIDSAGNQASTSFTFALDSSPPHVSVENLGFGDAVARGVPISISVNDVFLRSVHWSIDGGTLQMLESPYKIDTGSLAPGWHEIVVTADDLSGKQSTVSLSIYVDIAPPEVVMDSPGNFLPNNALQILVHVSDDFEVGSCILYYQLQGGGYDSVQMIPKDGAYVVQLATSMLWDGIDIFVVASDIVGNSAESSHFILHADAALPVDNGKTPSDDKSSNWPVLWSQGGYVALASAIIVSSMLIVGFSRRRKDHNQKHGGEETASRPVVNSGIAVSTFADIAATKGSATAALRKVTQSVKTATLVVTDPIQPKPTAALSTPSPLKRALLIEAIPDVRIKSPLSADETDEDNIDYGDLIERELVSLADKRSVFGSESEKELDNELDSLFNTPQIMSGLRLKRVME